MTMAFLLDASLPLLLTKDQKHQPLPPKPNFTTTAASRHRRHRRSGCGRTNRRVLNDRRVLCLCVGHSIIEDQQCSMLLRMFICTYVAVRPNRTIQQVVWIGKKNVHSGRPIKWTCSCCWFFRHSAIFVHLLSDPFFPLVSAARTMTPIPYFSPLNERVSIQIWPLLRSDQNCLATPLVWWLRFTINDLKRSRPLRASLLYSTRRPRIWRKI